MSDEIHKGIRTGYTYEDVLLVPKRSGVKSRREVSTRSKASRNIPLNIPVIASNMDTVCETQMAVEMARQGGIGILHRFCSIDEQCDMVRRVKLAQSFIVAEPRTIRPDATKAEAEASLHWTGRRGGVHSLMVTAEDMTLLGIVTRSDLEFAPSEARVQDLMTPRDRIRHVTKTPNLTLEAARKLLFTHRLQDLPIIDEAGKLAGLITAADVRKLTSNLVASLDKRGRLLVGAAVGVKADDFKRAQALIASGADVLVIDIAHGHSDVCIEMLRRIKSDPTTKHVDVIAGNIATKEAAIDLIEAGADALKVGVGPGSICITRLVAGAGVPQLTALMDVASVANAAGVPVIADGGVRNAGDISKAMAAGADTVMLGNMLAGTDEAPGQVLVKDGKKVKIIRGMAGYGANVSKAQREAQQEDDVFLDLVPEGVEGNVPYKGPVAPILKQLVGGLRSGISYCGARNIEEMRRNATFVRMTAAGIRESGWHDISKL
jgi:IMP dehydrogenase